MGYNLFVYIKIWIGYFDVIGVLMFKVFYKNVKDYMFEYRGTFGLGSWSG